MMVGTRAKMKVGVVFANNRASDKTWIYSPCVCSAANDHCNVNWGQNASERIWLMQTHLAQVFDQCNIVRARA